MYSRLVEGVGSYSKGKYLATLEGKVSREYQIWVNMLKRCYNQTYQQRFPTYQGCVVSKNFRNFQFFAEWCNNQIGFDNKGWCLDKDLIFKGNKVYSENTCVFLPREINMLLINRGASRGVHPLGVSYHKQSGKFQTTFNKNGKTVHLGIFLTEECAFACYKEVKEMHIKEIAEKYKNQISEKAYQSLISWEVGISG